MLDRRAQFSAALGEAREALDAAAKHRPKRLSPTAETLLRELASAVEELREGDDAAAD
jgi:hypothetical protein